MIQIRTLVSHVMESGQRKDADGKLIPRKIINRFTCTFNGRPVFACDIEPAIAANPYLEFSARVEESGTFRFTWAADDGAVISATEKITVRGDCRCAQHAVERGRRAVRRAALRSSSGAAWRRRAILNSAAILPRVPDLPS